MLIAIRAEDFSVDEAGMVAGGRLLGGGTVVSVHAEKRLSAELLGLGLYVFGLATLAFVVQTMSMLLLLLVLVLPALGLLREVARSWVLVLEIYQIGKVEVRGFTRVEGLWAVELVVLLRERSAGRGLSPLD